MYSLFRFFVLQIFITDSTTMRAFRRKTFVLRISWVLRGNT